MRCMKLNVKIQNVSRWSIVLTIVVAVVFILVAIQGGEKFKETQTMTKQYISCQNAAKQLQDGSDYLTEQVRLYAITGKNEYMNLYFEEANFTRSRENALEDLGKYFSGTTTFEKLQEALDNSTELMNTEYYSMRLVCEAMGRPEAAWPEEIRNVEISGSDKRLTETEKMEKARRLVSDDYYQGIKKEITDNVTQCMNSLLRETRNSQGEATSDFANLCRNLEIGTGVVVVLMIVICLMIRRLVVKPLMIYDESIQKGEIFPVVGALELQNLAETYNKVYQENQETQKLIRHQAEHDALTELLNRGAYERILNIYETGDSPFALILIDVDTFKSVNDTYGHAMGDEILKKVAMLLKRTFRSIDFVCRIGGDEFAIIMVEMTSDLKYTIEDKITVINEILSQEKNGVPAVSLSVGVAFSDRDNAEDDIFKDADKALYYIKEHGRHGCKIF